MPTTNTTRERTAAHAEKLRSLHRGVKPLVLPNAWDAMSAAVIAREGASAIATTSGGVSWAHGCPDGHGIDASRAIDTIREIAAMVDIPVSADIEAGYGATSGDVGATMEAVVDAGAAGVNLEDAIDGVLLDPAAQAERIAAARVAADGCDVAVVINARTDVYLLGGSGDALDDVIARAEHYKDAGADCIFVPGLTDLETIDAFVTRSPLPVNIMAGPGAPTIKELADVGVARVSVGTAIAQAAYELVRAAAAELLTTGTYEALTPSMAYGELNAYTEGQRA